MERNVVDAFLKNRAELLPDDVWGQFIVPHFLSGVSFFKEKKAVKIEGGRGCGKTMLMRYLCHPSVFSPNRSSIPDSALDFIGLYWKPDIRFCKLLVSSWLGDDADIVFSYYFALSVVAELGKSIRSLSRAALASGELNITSRKIPRSVRKYLGEEVDCFSDVELVVEEKLSELELWVQNPSLDRPVMFDFKKILRQLIQDISLADPRLNNVFFRIFVDEFENLQAAQQLIINDYVKQPDTYYCINFSVRSHAISEFITSTQEQLIEPHDYRTVNIEAELSKQEGGFELLAAELVVLRLYNEGYSLGLEGFNKELLFDADCIIKRSRTEYKQAVLGKAREIFPQLSTREVAGFAVKDKALKNRLVGAIKKALIKRGDVNISPDLFFDGVSPEVSVVSASILNRETSTTVEILEELEKSKNNQKGQFLKPGGWVENTLFGSLLYLYKGLPQKDCLLYAGFKRFCGLSSPNLRYFQELCHKALLEENSVVENLGRDCLEVSPGTQASAAFSVSSQLLAEVERAGTNGKKLHSMIMRLGAIFESSQRRPGQSEPEVNHFSINDNQKIALSDEVATLINDGLMWSVLYVSADTKNKSDYDIMQSDYMPNPIFAPYFGISYRKKRKLSFSADEVNTLYVGSGEQFKLMLKNYVDRWEEASEDNVGANYRLLF
ncbi:ORC-CDC6 family AAA ATPase [Pseudomonas asiatica]|uniref:ORC-CDC6 family AAA ATPase n=1 Tax=Pseudomonas asiatica TaxID=2219225 RepID=UPI00345A63BE